jgi:zinc transport system ATP-binding protein
VTPTGTSVRSRPVLVTIRDLCVTLGGNPILRGVNADLRAGGISALIGLNGSGKTTLLRALVHEVPWTGQVHFHCGHDHTRALPEHIGYVPQRLRIDSNLPLTVADLFALALQRRPLFLGIAHWVQREMDRLLQRVGAGHLADRLVEKLSGGQLQRVLLALALQPKPELLLLDEPAAGIDFQDQQRFYDLLADLNRETGVTILLVSHDLSVVGRLVEHVFCLQDGRIVCEGSPHHILSSEVLARTFGPEMSSYLHHHHAHGPEGRPASNAG